MGRGPWGWRGFQEVIVPDPGRSCNQPDRPADGFFERLADRNLRAVLGQPLADVLRPGEARLDADGQPRAVALVADLPLGQLEPGGLGVGPLADMDFFAC